MLKYIWIIVLVLLFEFLVLLPFKDYFIDDICSIWAIVIFGNSCGAIAGFLISLLIDILVISFCEFFDTEWLTISQTIPISGTVAGAFVCYIYAIIEEGK